MSDPSLGEVVEVVETETVVRLDGTPGRLAGLVLTGDVAASLAALLEVAGGTGGGAGFFVVGPFGSGKSHFLAAFGELVADPGVVSDAPAWPAELRALAGGARRSVPVAVPLVEYRAEARLEDVVAERAWRALAPAVPPLAGNDRTAAWDAVLDAAVETGAPGLVLLLDELSEWLRAKQGPALTEDLRFLQFLGEWARQHPVVVVAALQESIEEVVNVSARELSRIRDRYRPSLTLSMRHVEDLVRGRLVRLRPGAETWVRAAYEQLEASFPASPVSYEAFLRCYPLHPETLSVLEGLRFLLSQQRGVVDFVGHSLRAELDAPFAQLVTPDRVYDHFAGRLQERPETARLAGTVVAFYERSVGDLVDEEDRELALRAVKLLVLLAASPLERPRTAAQLAGMLQARVSDLEPAANVSYLEAAVLRPLAERGAYLVVDPGPPPTYRVDVGADAALVLAARVQQIRSETNPADRRLVATLAELGSSVALPLQTLRELGSSRRELLWHNTLRSLVVGTVRLAELAPADVDDAVSRARAAGAEGCLLIAEPELSVGDGATALAAARAATDRLDRIAVWVPAAFSREEHDRLIDIHARRQALAQAGREGQTELTELAERSAEADATMARELLRRVYFEGLVLYPTPTGQLPETAGADLPSLAGQPFERQLVRLADPLLARLHPLHAQVAPRGELVGERILRALVHEAIPLGRLPPAAMAQLRPVVDGYLVPLGLARSRRDGAVIAPDPARSPAVRELLSLVGDDGAVATDVVARLGDGPVGLTGPEAVLVLNACVRAGLVEMTRGRHQLTEPFMSVTPTDRLFAGELVEPAGREVLGRLGPISGPGPFEPWTAATQRTAWQYAQAWLDARREDLAQIAEGLAAAEAVPVLAGTDTGALRDDAAAVSQVVAATTGAATPVTGLRALVAAIDDPEAVLDAARRVARVARFLRDDLRRLEEAAAYLTHPDLDLPEEAVELRDARRRALGLLGESLALAAAEHGEEVWSGVREFRTAYLAAYQDAHDLHQAAAVSGAADAVRATPAYRALAALSDLGAVAVPDDRVKVDRAMAAAAPAPCPRRVDQELLWKPTCSCGLHLGDPRPEVDRAGLTALAERGVAEYLVELSRPELAGRLSAAAADLGSLGRVELAADMGRLVTLAAEASGSGGSSGSGEPSGSGRASGSETVSGSGDAPSGPDVAATGAAPGSGSDPTATVLTELLGEELRRTVRDALTGSQLIATRDLATLREDLIDRRYPKRRLLELLAAWVDAEGVVPVGGFVQVVDSAEAASGSGRTPGGATTATGGTGRPPVLAHRSPTVALLQARWPSVASQLPATEAAEAFWLAAWWSSRPGPPAWLPAGLLADADRLADAAAIAVGEPEALAELADLDRRAGTGTVLGGQIAAALDLDRAATVDVLAILAGERLLRHPLRLAAAELLRRLAGDWVLLDKLGRPDIARMASRHALVDAEELVALEAAVEAAAHLAAVERSLDGVPAASLVDDVYAGHAAAVPALLSRAELGASSGPSLVEPSSLVPLRTTAARLLVELGEVWSGYADAGWPGCLPVWDIGREVVAPLLRTHGRVAVLLVDALRADLALQLAPALAAALPDRVLQRRWAVVPAPTRTAESLAALATGRPAPGGSVAPGPGQGDAAGPTGAPFAHLGYETAVLLRADRDHQAVSLRELWAGGPPVSVAVATGVDERLHRTSVELAALLDEAVVALRRRVLPSLATLPAGVPLVVLADHGFRENPAWGKGPEGRYVHGGTSLEECVIPVFVLAAGLESVGPPAAPSTTRSG